jgi:hypothetical protein
MARSKPLEATYWQGFFSRRRARHSATVRQCTPKVVPDVKPSD